MKNILILCLLVLIFNPAIAASTSAKEGGLEEGLVNPGFYEKPDWFKQTFLDLVDDLDDANTSNKIIFLYFHQDGCPYCKKLLEDNFTNKEIVSKMKQHYEVLEINMWGDRPVILMNGEEVTEKEFAKQMKVMFTPTLIALDTQGKPMFRMNGYYAPDKFTLVLDYLLLKKQKMAEGSKTIPSFKAFYQQQMAQKKSTKKSAGLFTEKFIVPTDNLQALIESSNKPVMILFEQADCAECKELHGDVFRRLPVFQKLKKYTIAQIDINSPKEIITPEGQKMSQKDYAEALNIQYTPSIYFYEPEQKGAKHEPVFKAEAYLKAFHTQVLFDYILDKEYLKQPEFQRYVQGYAEKLREQGKEVDLWK